MFNFKQLTNIIQNKENLINSWERNINSNYSLYKDQYIQ